VTEAEKELFESRVNGLMAKVTGERKDTVFAMISPAFAACEPENHSVTLQFQGKPWEENGTGVLHGGIISAMMDIALGTLTYAISGSLTPTVTLNVAFDRAAKGDGLFFIRADADMAGRNLLYVHGTMWDSREPDKPVATAQAVFRNATGETLKK